LLTSITSGLRINLCRLLQHLMERMTAPILLLFGRV
jgi:hypothetical protein